MPAFACLVREGHTNTSVVCLLWSDWPCPQTHRDPSKVSLLTHSQSPRSESWAEAHRGTCQLMMVELGGRRKPECWWAEESRGERKRERGSRTRLWLKGKRALVSIHFSVLGLHKACSSSLRSHRTLCMASINVLPLRLIKWTPVLLNLD